MCLKILILIWGIAYITMGTVYLNSCTEQYLIPIYLIVSGSFTLFLLMISLIPCAPNDESNNLNLHKVGRVCERLVSLFSTIWFITGSVWIYSIYEPDYIDKASPHYCDKNLYLFAFSVTTANYIILTIMICLGFGVHVLGGILLIGQRDG
ncbi:transmembrane protein 272-like isoform X2 [Carcharodon carcharias]|uniref:transmembrane protein 272-like isoform X2 n=1 Tax=Carcharodon carcharias TaxID=13397 RepID=UPI001B7D917F|nr:transmembrane protein 272-like isoform X2 [Carcharodon carcharias]